MSAAVRRPLLQFAWVATCAATQGCREGEEPADLRASEATRYLGVQVETMRNWARKGIVLAGSLGSRGGFRTEVGRPARPGRADGGVGHPRLSGPATRGVQSCGPEELSIPPGPRSIDRRVR